MFRPGDTVVFEINHFNIKFWQSLSEENRIKYYGPFGYGGEKPKFFTFITEHYPQNGHCILMDMDNGQLFPMCHMNNFRLVKEEEC